MEFPEDIGISKHNKHIQDKVLYDIICLIVGDNMVCKNCGKDNIELADRCLYCNKKLVNESSSTKERKSILSKVLVVLLGIIIVVIANLIGFFATEWFVSLKNCSSLDDFSNDMCMANANFWGYVVIIILFLIIKKIIEEKF